MARVGGRNAQAVLSSSLQVACWHSAPPARGKRLTPSVGVAWSPGPPAGCDAFSPVRAADGRHYTSFGDCNGLTGKQSKLSMGFGRIIGGPTNPTVQDLPTPELRDVGNGAAGRKPSSALIVGSRLYMWIRNYAPGGTQARLKYSDDFTRSDGNSNWTWAPLRLTHFGYPVFVQGKTNDAYAYIIAHDNKSAYTPADRYVLMRVPRARLATRRRRSISAARPRRRPGAPASRRAGRSSPHPASATARAYPTTRLAAAITGGRTRATARGPTASRSGRAAGCTVPGPGSTTPPSGT